MLHGTSQRPLPSKTPRHMPPPTDHLLAKPDRAGSPPGQTTNGAGHGGPGIVRGCPLATARVRCEWHGSGTAGDDDGGEASQRRHQIDRRVRPVSKPPDLLARAAGPRQRSGGIRTRRHPAPSSVVVGSNVLMTWHSCMPAMTPRGRRGPAVVEAVRIQRGPARRRQLGKHGCLLVIRRWPNQPRP
jgi:hypothetical protein